MSGGEADEARQRRRRHLVTPQELEGECTTRLELPNDHTGRDCIGRGGEHDGLVLGDRGVSSWALRDRHQMGRHTQLCEQVRDGSVQDGTIAVPRNGEPLISEILGVHRADPRKRMTGADENHPLLDAEREAPEVG
jgi:hypothetical protein